MEFGGTGAKKPSSGHLSLVLQLPLHSRIHHFTCQQKELKEDGFPNLKHMSSKVFSSLQNRKTVRGGWMGLELDNLSIPDRHPWESSHIHSLDFNYYLNDDATQINICS